MATTNDTITVTDAPAIPGLTFRGFRGEADYTAMVQVIEESKQADQIERTQSVEDVARDYEHLVNSDPYRDMLFAEMHGKVIGYSRVWWNQQLDGARTYQHFVVLTPEWRGKGLLRAMLRYNERRLREIAGDHPADGPRSFEVWVADTEAEWEALLVAEGYQGVRYALRMVRPNLKDIPDLPLPEGLQVRPVLPEHYRTVWKAAAEAFRDAWGASEWRDEDLENWMNSPTFMPELWQVAWDGEQVAGMVLNYINEAENEEYDRKRGHTEPICVRRPWRRRGLARALIARSFRVLKEQGMTEAALGLDAQNLSGALRLLYESMGYRVVKRFTTFRKETSPPFAGGQP
jgi:ribosomal protein S18 acetylase RimI-like enzyme